MSKNSAEGAAEAVLLCANSVGREGRHGSCAEELELRHLDCLSFLITWDESLESGREV